MEKLVFNFDLENAPYFPHYCDSVTKSGYVVTQDFLVGPLCDLESCVEFNKV